MTRQFEKLSPYKVWVLAPKLETEDPNLSYYYDFSQSIEEYTSVFAEMCIEWEWVYVTMTQIKSTVSRIAKSQKEKEALVLNLCDGDEINGAPGVSVIDELEKQIDEIKEMTDMSRSGIFRRAISLYHLAKKRQQKMLKKIKRAVKNNELSI